VQVPTQIEGKFEDDSIQKVHAKHNAAASSTSKHALKQARLLHSDQKQVHIQKIQANTEGNLFWLIAMRIV
jgi:hypothetical protein